MPVTFKDRKGDHGEVTDSFEVRYSGEWKDEVRAVVSEVADETPDDVVTELLLELPEQAPLTEVRRDEGDR